jgi:hypothetical protein
LVVALGTFAACNHNTETIAVNGTTNGMYGVLTNTCGQSFTYHFDEITGQVSHILLFAY